MNHQREMLYAAIENCDLDCVKMLVRSGADLSEDPINFTPLMRSIWDAPIIAFYLVDRGVDLNIKCKGSPGSIERGMTALMFAALRGRSDLLSELLKRGADVRAKTALKRNALSFACEGRHLKAAQLLLAAGSDVPNDALVFPVAWGCTELCHLLVDAGANTTAKVMSTVRGGAQIVRHMTILGLAIQNLHYDLASLLIRAGADVNGMTMNRPPVNLAARFGHKEIVRQLLAAGASVNAQDSAGGTALTEAVDNGSIEVIELLLKAKASPNLPRHDGETAYTLACHKGIPQVIELVKAAGGIPPNNKPRKQTSLSKHFK